MNITERPSGPTLDYLANGEDVLLEIDVQGALQVRFQYPDALMIFIMPPDEASLLQRLRERGRDSDEAIEKTVPRIAPRNLDGQRQPRV